jgi:hypothetical protein
MPVVISEFETVADAPRERAGDAEAPASKPDQHEPPDPKDMTPILRALAIRALRAWAH